MARGKDLTTTELNEMRSLLNEGLSYAEVAELIGRNKKSVANAAFRYKLKDSSKSAKKQETPKEWNSELVKKTIENTNKPVEPVMKEPVKEKTFKDFNPRDIIKYMYGLGYRIEDNKLVCYVKQTVNVKDIVNG